MHRAVVSIGDVAAAAAVMAQCETLTAMRWLWIAMLALTGLVVVETGRDSLVMAVVYGVLGLALSWWLSPWWAGRGTSHADIERMPASGRPVVIYGRPGCAYCARMRVRLARAGRRAIWVNIWQDPAAAAFVRSVNDGDETVPTVVIDGQPLTNPAPALVLDRLKV